MTEFRSWRSYQIFANKVATKRRYIFDVEQKEFLAAVLDSAKERRCRLLKASTPLWRAQIGTLPEHSSELATGIPLNDRKPFGIDRMKPRQKKAREGRANPKGIPYLYAAFEELTAVSEVRPPLRALVSVGLFQTNTDLRIVQCVPEQTKQYVTDLRFEQEPSGSEKEDAVWLHIDSAFSQLVYPDDDVATYAPTQVLAEYFRYNGFDGIEYRSSQNQGGRNVALFDTDVVDLVQSRITSIKRATYVLSDPWSIQ